MKHPVIWSHFQPRWATHFPDEFLIIKIKLDHTTKYGTLEIHFEKHPNTSQSIICFRDIASVLGIDITM